MGEAPLRAFSVCFDDPSADERPFLQHVVNHVEVENVRISPDGNKLFEELPKMLWHQDEPFAGTSFLAQWAVMKEARTHGITVLLDGQGGDELLCGYPGYWGSYFGDLVRDGALVTALVEAVRCVRRQPRIHPTLLANLGRALLPARVVSQARWFLKAHASWINGDFGERYQERRHLALYKKRFPSHLGNHVAAYLQSHSLPALLHHEDRNSMAFSVESRLPFLDAPLVEFLLQLPPELKLRNGLGKHLLREAMTGILPEAVRRRRDKMGFATPQDRWLRQTMQQPLQELFSSRSFAQRGYWDQEKVRHLYRAYCGGGGGDVGASLWRCACVELWHEQFSI